MDIRILRDGIEIGPFTEETVQNLLQQGSIAITDLAWCAGLPQWVPLANLLYATDAPPPPPGSMPPPPPPAPTQASPAPEDALNETRDPATPKQRAFLTFMGISFPPKIDREAASVLVNEAMENPRDAARLDRWNKERLKLHPDLFAAEIQAAKEQRAQHFFDVCETEGEPWFTKVTKAHCQVLVGFLDVHHPNWDTDPASAAESYFFPAIAEKFPQLLTKEAKGRFKYPEGPKVAKELASRSPVAMKARRSSPVTALVRGVFFGVLILGMLWFVKGVISKGGKSADAKNAGAQTSPASRAASPGQPGDPATPATAVAPQGDPAKALAQNPPAGNGVVATTTNTGGNPAEMTPAGNPPTAMTPEAPATAGTPDPFAPPAEALPALAPPAPPGMQLVLTKPIEIQAKFGKIKLPPGTPVKLIQQNGAVLTVQVAGSDVTTIPASSTNLGAEPIPTGPPTPAAPAPAPAPVAPAPATPAPASDSLFGPPSTSPPGTARANPSTDL